METDKPTGFKAISGLRFTRHAQDQLMQAGMTWSPNRLILSMVLMTIPGLALGFMWPVC